MKKFLGDAYYTAVLVKLIATDAPKLFDVLFKLHWYKTLHEDWLAEVCLHKKNGYLLEVGCGPGQLAKSVASRGNKVVALDKSKRMLTKARRNLDKFTNLEFVHSSAESIPYKNDCFDFAIAASLINVVDEPAGILREMARVVRQDGVVSFLVPSNKMQASAASRYIRENGLEGMSSSALRMWATMAKKLSEARCHSICKQAGLENVVVKPRLDGMIYTVTGVVSSTLTQNNLICEAL